MKRKDVQRLAAELVDGIEQLRRDLALRDAQVQQLTAERERLVVKPNLTLGKGQTVDDIVTRLRNLLSDAELIGAAASEIEWLRIKVEHLRAAGDALAVRHRKTFGLDGAFDAELRQWEEARRG